MSVHHHQAVLESTDGEWVVYRFSANFIDDPEPSGRLRIHTRSFEWEVIAESSVSKDLGNGMTSSRLAALRLARKVVEALRREGAAPKAISFIA